MTSGQAQLRKIFITVKTYPTLSKKYDELVCTAGILDEFATKDLYLFLGTTREFHGRAPNPFVIIGVFYPPIERQQRLF